MTEISSHFCLIAPELISEALKLQRVTYIPSGAEEFACTAPVSINQTPTSGAAGQVWDISFTAVTDDRAIRKYNGRRFYIAILMSDGSARIIGTSSEVPMVTVEPAGQSSNRVTTSFRSAVPIDL